VFGAAQTSAPLRNLVLLAAPIDFSKSEGAIAAWAGGQAFNVDHLVDTLGNIPGELIKNWAKIIRPAENLVGVYVTMLKLMEDQTALLGWKAMNRWVEEAIPFAGEAFRQFIKEYVRGNGLVTGRVVAGRQLALKHIRVPLLNIIAQYDHLVARSQAETIMDLVSSEDKTFKVIPAPHVGIMISRSARYQLWPEIAEWLAPRSK